MDTQSDIDYLFGGGILGHRQVRGQQTKKISRKGAKNRQGKALRTLRIFAPLREKFGCYHSVGLPPLAEVV